MRYLEQTFTFPVSTGRLTQTDYEIRVGLRNPDGSLRVPRQYEPRYACVHEPVGLYETCEFCGPSRGKVQFHHPDGTLRLPKRPKKK